MKLSTLFTCAATAALVACDRGPTVPPSDFGRPSLAAFSTTDNYTIQIDLAVFVSCANGGAGEVVLLSGPLHVLFHTTVSDAGNYSTKYHFQPQGISGEGLVTGDKYQATGGTQDEFHIEGALPITETYVNNFRIIGQGRGNNFLVHENFHITINANGVVTAFVDNFSVECK
jgi:hypothetical protein